MAVFVARGVSVGGRVEFGLGEATATCFGLAAAALESETVTRFPGGRRSVFTTRAPPYAAPARMATIAVPRATRPLHRFTKSTARPRNAADCAARIRRARCSSSQSSTSLRPSGRTLSGTVPADDTAKGIDGQGTSHSGLVLKSTIIGVSRRAAYINRKLYSEGSTFEENGVTYKLTAVYPDKVELRQGNRVFELSCRPAAKRHTECP